MLGNVYRACDFTALRGRIFPDKTRYESFTENNKKANIFVTIAARDLKDDRAAFETSRVLNDLLPQVERSTL